MLQVRDHQLHGAFGILASLLNKLSQSEVQFAKALVARSRDLKDAIAALLKVAANELSQLKLTGTLRFNKQYFGLIQTPDNGIYRVRPGSFVGPNFGIVRKVSETEVVLEETVENINGEWVQQENTLYLLQQEQGAKP